MLAKIRVWIEVSTVGLLVGELFLFPFKFIFPPLMVLKQTWPIQVLVGYCIILFNMKIQTCPIPQRIIMLGITLPLCCWATTSFWGAEELRNSAQMGDNRYYFTTRTKVSDPACDFFCNFTVPILYKCDSIGLECKIIFQNDFMNILESGLAVDKDANELQLFLSYGTGEHATSFHEYGLSHVYGKQPRTIEASGKFGGVIYYLTTPQTQEACIFCAYSPIYMLYKCNQDSLDCKRLLFEYTDKNRDDLVINVDDIGKLSVVAYGYNVNSYELLVYTYDIQHSQSVCYVDNCTLKDE
jgi:hypothetical protein